MKYFNALGLFVLISYLMHKLLVVLDEIIKLLDDVQTAEEFNYFQLLCD